MCWIEVRIFINTFIHNVSKLNTLLLYFSTHKLVQWLNLLFQSHELVGTFYTSWSYVAQTGFRDALKSIDQLTKYEFFDLPVDLAIRNLANIKDVFS